MLTGNQIASCWMKYAQARLRAHGLIGLDGTEDEYGQKVLVPRLTRAIVRVYWKALLDSANDFGIVRDDAMRKLGLSDATVSRQNREQILPTIQTFFGVLVLVFKETRISNSRIPDYADLIYQASQATIGQIRCEDFGLEARELRRSYLECVRLRCLRQLTISDDQLNTIASELDIGYPDEKWDRNLVERTLDDWLDSYVVFQVGLEHILG